MTVKISWFSSIFCQSLRCPVPLSKFALCGARWLLLTVRQSKRLEPKFPKEKSTQRLVAGYQLAAGPLQSSSGRLAQHFSWKMLQQKYRCCPPRGGVSSEHHREGGLRVTVLATIQNPKYTFWNINFWRSNKISINCIDLCRTDLSVLDKKLKLFSLDS